MYAVTVNAEFSLPKLKSSWHRTIPTFFLDENVQFIKDELHAERIALDVLNPFGFEGVKYHICVVRLK